MGYSYEMFFDIERLSLPKGARVLDLGSQDINIGSPDVLDAVNRFIAQYADDRLPESIIGTMIEAAEIWQMAGFDHRCIDFDDRPHTLRVDLQNFVFPTELRGQFDLVTNMGTTEHLASPMVGLALMHYACKVGGAMFTDTPIFGFGNHGLANLTPKFWHQLSLFNRYKVAICRLRKCDESLFDPGNIYHSDMAYMEGLQDARNL